LKNNNTLIRYNRDSTVGAVHWLWTAQYGVQIPVRVGDFFILLKIQSSCGVHPLSRAIGMGDSSPEIKAVGM